MMQRQYLKTLFFVFFTGLGLVGSFCWLVDPYRLYESPEIKGFNAIKVEAMNSLRLTKAWLVKEKRPTAIILGTSRAGRGLSTQHPVWESDQTYNLSLPATTVYEFLRLFQHANSLTSIEKMVVALDYRSFVGSDQFDESFESRLAVTSDGDKNNKYLKAYFHDRASTLLSFDAFLDSLKTIRKQSYAKNTFYKNGSWSRITELYDHHDAFNAYTKNTLGRLGKLLNTEVEHQSSYLSSSFNSFRALLRYAYENNVELHIAISPSHAWHWEAYRASGLWHKLEDWKRMLVRINIEEAERAKRQLFPLWDFSGYNSITIENVPPRSASNSRMKWFWESVHYKIELGDLMLDRIFSYSSHDRVLPDDFGALITTDNIEFHLVNTRKIQQNYLRSHIDDVEHIERMAREIQTNEFVGLTEENSIGMLFSGAKR